MSTDRDVTRIVRSWLHEDAHEDADRLLSLVLDEVDTNPQRSASWLARRLPIMNNNIVRFGIAAAVALVAVAVGIQLFNGSDVGGPGATETPQPTSTSTPEPSPSADGVAEGPFILWQGRAAGPLTVTVTIPAPGWYGITGVGILNNHEEFDLDGAGMRVSFGDLYVYGDSCRWSTTTPDTPATTVDEVVAALTAQASQDASAPVDITVDAYAGKSITLHVPDDAVSSDCDQDTNALWAVSIDGAPGLDPHLGPGPGKTAEVWILDVNGVVVVLDLRYGEGTPAKDVAELRAIVESATFE